MLVTAGLGFFPSTYFFLPTSLHLSWTSPTPKSSCGCSSIQGRFGPPLLLPEPPPLSLSLVPHPPSNPNSLSLLFPYPSIFHGRYTRKLMHALDASNRGKRQHCRCLVRDSFNSVHSSFIFTKAQRPHPHPLSLSLSFVFYFILLIFFFFLISTFRWYLLQSVHLCLSVGDSFSTTLLSPRTRICLHLHFLKQGEQPGLFGRLVS